MSLNKARCGFTGVTSCAEPRIGSGRTAIPENGCPSNRCRWGLIATILLAATLGSLDSRGAERVRAGSVQTSVVRIYSTIRQPDTYKPWLRQTPTEITGSGVVIDGKRILTCAHVVNYASQVKVQADQSSERVSATVQAIAPGIDLAILTLEDNSFFDSHPPLARSARLPDTRDTVMAYGYPQGGNTLSITKGIISRIEFATYSGGVGGLRIQIDAAINPGNSGGPAVVADKMIGLAFRYMGGAQSIGYIIPCEEIELFLQDIADGHYDGKPLMLDSCQGTANPAMRSYLKLDKSVQGVVVTKPHLSDAAYPLKENDMITRIGSTPLDNEGMIQADGNLRLFFKYMIQKIARNGTVPLTVIRDGRRMEIELPVQSTYPLAIPDLKGAYPSYFVCGPLVFSGATLQYVGGFMMGQAGGTRMAMLMATGNPMVKRLGDPAAFEGEQLVVVATLFPHKLTAGYGNPTFEVVKSLNGINIRSLGHLVEALRDLREEFVIIELDSNSREHLVFPRKEMLAATEDILTDNSIRSQGSPDMLAIWNRQRSQ